MADFFDWFGGSAVLLNSHAPDSGGGVTWNDPDNTFFTNGSGAVYGNNTAAGNFTLNNWTPPGTDYAVAVQLGANIVSGASNAAGTLRRIVGAPGSQSAYLFQLAAPSGTLQFSFYRHTAATSFVQLGATQPVTGWAPGDVMLYTVAGTGGTVTLNAYRNGTLFYTIPDTDPSRITSAGAIGFRHVGGTSGVGDFIRSMWAGAIAGPAALTIAPPSPTVGLGLTQSFTLSAPFTNEAFGWSASAGSISGALPTATWTAPGTGTSATVTGRSTDLPILRTATATATLTSASATTFTLTGPSSGFAHNASGNFTFKPNLSYTGTITPTMTGLAGTWSPSSLTWAASATAQTATFTPSAVGTGNANGTAAPSLTAPANVAYTSNAQTLAVGPANLPTSSTTAVTFSGGGTLWTTAAPTFTPTGVAGVSCGAVTVASDTSAQAPVTTSMATGTITWTDSTTAATATGAVAGVRLAFSIAEGFATGLTTVGYAVYNDNGSLYSAWTTAGVAERGAGSGDYGAMVTVGTVGGYEVRWSQNDGNSPPYVHDHISDRTGYKLAADGWDAVMIETGVNARQATAVILASAAGVLSGATGTSVAIKGANVTTTRITATVDASGNRSAVALSLPN